MLLVTSLPIEKKSRGNVLVDMIRYKIKFSTALAKAATSSLKDSEEQTSPPVEPGSRGVQVASSHFSKINANRGKSG